MNCNLLKKFVWHLFVPGVMLLKICVAPLCSWGHAPEKICVAPLCSWLLLYRYKILLYEICLLRHTMSINIKYLTLQFQDIQVHNS